MVSTPMKRWKKMALPGDGAVVGAMSRTLRWATMAILAAISGWTGRAAVATMPPPASRWEIDFTSGVLWKMGGGTPLAYTLLPQIISLKIPPISERPWHGGTLVYRTRLSLLLEPIVRGPEHFYTGVTASGELEWRSRSQRFSGFFGGGGGFGVLDSRGYEIPGGQGQDFNLNWMLQAGARFRTASDWWLTFGVYFQHISNRGMDKVNPGLNAIGPTFGIARKY